MSKNQNEEKVGVAHGQLSCPLCGAHGIALVFSRGGRDFFECSVCDLLFVDPTQFISKEAERGRYELHKNSYEDVGYRKFLCHLKDALKSKLAPGMSGLDFGCGVSGAMARLFKEDGFHVDGYDPVCVPELRLEDRSFDFITCCEVVEHFREPGVEFTRLWQLLRDGGWLGVMTNLRDEHRGDLNWWYLRDSTHVCFYSRRTFEWIARAYCLEVEIVSASVGLFQK